jgi:ABC-2 type transport system permease protein
MMIIALYIVILLYGQMVTMSVATEKSSRAMELLITSAKPTNMMFGKVFAACLAGFSQLAVIFGSVLVFYNINRDYWSGFEMADMFFDIPPELLVYMMIFFVLGFLVYAFLFGAVGSTVSKLEEVNTAISPIMYVFVAMYILVIVALTSGEVDTVLMKVCSFIPLTSPMAMFTRIALSTVPLYEIIISIALLVASVFGIGFISAKIYRVGVLLYGTPPKIGAIIKAMRKA